MGCCGEGRWWVVVDHPPPTLTTEIYQTHTESILKTLKVILSSIQSCYMAVQSGYMAVKSGYMGLQACYIVAQLGQCTNNSGHSVLPATA